MEHQFLHLIIMPLVKQPKCEPTANEHSMYIILLWSALKTLCIEVQFVKKLKQNRLIPQGIRMGSCNMI